MRTPSRFRPLLFIFCLFTTFSTFAQEATWIWYPGDFEINLANKMQNRRTERGSYLLPFWKMDAHYVVMNFQKEINLAQPEVIKLYVQGEIANVQLDGKNFGKLPKQITIPAGKHILKFKIFNQSEVPAIYVKGNTVVSDYTWKTTYEDKEWIDETGKASDGTGTAWVNAGSWNLNDPLVLPADFKLKTELQNPVATQKTGNATLYDFGKETFGFIKLNGLKGNGRVKIYYGESKEEALSITDTETTDEIEVNIIEPKDSTMLLSKAFRFVNVIIEGNVAVNGISMLYEFSSVTERGSFKCSDEQINQIYDIAKYTFRLNTREFFIDGIKRDRWVWSGDAYQSYLMNYYLYFDSPTVTRTLLALRGKNPVTSHINTIMDYTFYWFLGIYDYYLYTGDKAFIQQMYPSMQTLMEYCLSRRNKNGFMEGLAGDWIFIDWADGLSKKGEVSFEQLLLCRSLETMALCADLSGDKTGRAKYLQIHTDLKAKLFNLYWNNSKQALVHSRINGKQTDNVTRYANMFSIFFNYFNEQQKQGVKKNVLQNDKIQKITTPYMRFYELEALCAMGEQSYVLKEMKDYWGGMLALGATSFWEEYNPTKKGEEHYAMYGRKFGKSLCHAWGASPIYLLGKYYLGIKPTAPAYKTYAIEPVLGGLQWMEGKVPTPNGEISLYCNNQQIKVLASEGEGILRFKSKVKPNCKQGTALSKGNSVYELVIQKGVEYVVDYAAL